VYSSILAEGSGEAVNEICVIREDRGERQGDPKDEAVGARFVVARPRVDALVGSD